MNRNLKIQTVLMLNNKLAIQGSTFNINAKYSSAQSTRNLNLV